MIEKMDDNTTLVMFGDHGMRYTGSHGGGSEVEKRTAFFAYQKTPFGQAYRENKHHFQQIDGGLKQSDLAPIAAYLTNTPIPFSNLGIVHPAFT